MYKKNPYIDAINANGRDFVEIGGVKWATCNVGAEKPYEVGLYFQWGDIEGWSSEDLIAGKKHIFTGYKFKCEKTFTKYNIEDKKQILDGEDDAAHAIWGGKWRMPTKDEFQQLLSLCDSHFIEDFNGTGANGYVFYEKLNPNKWLFFPACGWFEANSHSFSGINIFGCYWSSSIFTKDVKYAMRFSFDMRGVHYVSSWFRVCTCQIRGVLDC